MARALEIALDLADALTRAHRLGIIHRDLKPANVLLAEDGTPRLTDFGIARVSDSPRLTETGILVGTPDFLSPEACSGRALDERTDIWAFGVLLFEMLTGETPFRGDNLTAKLTAILTQPVPDLGERCPDAPEALVDLVYRMLEKDRGQRIPSVRLVGAELEAILKGREVPTPVLLAPGESRFATPTPPACAPRHNLPAQTTPFVGREDELAELDHLFADPAIRLVTILGPGGIGKTRLALESAGAQLDTYQHGVYFVPLAPLNDPANIVPTITNALDFQLHGDNDPKEQLFDYLRQKKILLLMDNFEHLVEGAGLFDDILHAAPEVKVLATSRQKLNLSGETIFTIGGMDFPDWETPEDALQYSAVKLFMQSARRAQASFELEAGDLKYVARICRLVQGLPLGILLAAAWIDVLSLEEITAEIAQSLDFLKTEMLDVPERQRSIRAMFESSWNLLTGEERDAFAKMSVFRGGCSRKAAQQVTGASLRLLTALVNKSLLGRNAATGHFEIHELLRQYAEEYLDASGEADTVRDTHCSYYTEVLRQHRDALVGRGQVQAMDDMRSDIENARAAWEWAVRSGRDADLEAAMESLFHFYELNSRYQEGAEAFRRAAEALRARDDDQPNALLGKVLTRWSRFCERVGRSEQARELATESVAIARQYGDRREEALATKALAHAAWRLYEYDEAKRRAEEALAIFEEVGDRWGMALSLHMLADTLWYRGESGKARPTYQKSLALYRESGDRWGVGRLLSRMGLMTAYQLGELAEARQLLEESRATLAKIGDRPGMAESIGRLGIVAGLMGEYEESRRLLREYVALGKELGDRERVAYGLGLLGIIVLWEGAPEEAEGYLQEGIATARETDDPWCVALATAGLGELAYERGQYEVARLHAGDALVYFRESGAIPWSWMPSFVLGQTACAQGELTEAWRHLYESLRDAMITRAIVAEITVLCAMAALLAAEGQMEPAVERLAFVLYHRATMAHDRKRASRLLAKLETALPPDVFAAAQERGKAWELEAVVAAAWERGRARDLDATVAELLTELGGTGTDPPDQSAGTS
jgi:predicted ATPase